MLWFNSGEETSDRLTTMHQTEASTTSLNCGFKNASMRIIKANRCKLVLGLSVVTISSLIFLRSSYFSMEDKQHGLEVTGYTPSLEKETVEQVNVSSVLCWVMTTTQRKQNALAAKNTWGKRCDKIIFFSDQLDTDLESVVLSGISEGGKASLWGKTRESLKYLYDYYLKEFDWFYKADDDTYVIVENLKYVLTPYDPEFPIALGERGIVGGNKRKHYLSGGSGYVLSRKALEIYGTKTYLDNKLCPKGHDGREDLILGPCLTKSGILLGDSRDELGKHRFHQNPADEYIIGKWQHRYPTVMIYKYDKGIDSLSQTPVSFHSLKNYELLYALEFFIYRIQLFGISGRFDGPNIAPLPPDVSSIPEEVLKRFGKSRVNEGGS
ncbi:glycoprotein-N-acetylgalactosamine 3-beta-galactosyltransferase 1-like isoform X2 [Palaemon carinicauda]|uniref:glycoprotein-N-acetylgalactosamine 3-beta-galactosyltransferase 1-like isoform X2 n=1 Tax=Palaemon carinicauda TaxID=392227 RepID=UPI0035B57DEB